MAIAMGIFVVVAAAAPVTHIAIDQLPRPAARTAAADKIAMALADKDAEFRRAAANCRAEADPHGFEYRVGARRLLESSTLYSVEIAASWDCGGAYPDRNPTALTFDLQSGSPHDLNRIFHVGSSHLVDGRGANRHELYEAGRRLRSGHVKRRFAACRSLLGSD
jgi:hypothetical protein